MKAIATVLVSSALLLAAAVPSWASDETRFEALVRKFVPEYAYQFGSFAPKTLCICEPGAQKKAGVLLTDGGFVGCVVPIFTDGKLTTFSSCATYAVIGK